MAVPRPRDYTKLYQPVKNVPGTVKPTTSKLGGYTDPGRITAAGGPAGLVKPTPMIGPAPPVAPPSLGKWNIPDYAGLLKTDWEPKDALIQGNKMRDTAQAGFQESLRRAFIDFGGDASKLGDYSKYIDPATIEAAKANKFSQTAQNLAAMTKTLANQRAQNAARGMSTSGRSVGQAREALSARELADVNAERGFLGAAGEGMAGLGDVETQIAELISGAKSRAAARISEENPQTWEPSPAAAAQEMAVASGLPVGISWGGKDGITTKAQLIKQLGPGQTYATWAKNHPAAAAKLR